MSKYLHFASFSVFLIAFISIFFPTWLTLFDRWGKMDQGYSHGYLVLMIAVYFVYQQIRLIEVDKVKVNYLFILPLLLCSLLWSLSYHANIEVVQQVLLPIMLALFFIVLLGIQSGQKFLFPVLILLFAIPFWDYLVPYLQNITVFVNAVLLDAAGIPAYIEGVTVMIPAGVFEIAGGCSGLRYLVTALTLAVLFIYLNYTRWITGFILLVTAVFFALLANWLRVFIVIVVGHETDMQSELIKDYDTLGSILFALTLIPFFYLANGYSVWFGDKGPERKLPTGQLPPYKVMPYIIVSLATFILPLAISSPGNEDNIDNVLPVFTADHFHEAKQLVHPVFHGA
ncbi:MAG: exosortase, partial [Thiotrichaceae bacterium]|nr:exosortase [Thiotrichaceae bacterium]